MLFNSFVFLGFFLLVFGAYVALQGRLRIQNAMLLLASWVFYGWWDFRFLSLLALSTVVDFYVGRAIDGLPRTVASNVRRKRLLAASMATNLGLLGFFKYFNFFSESTRDVLSSLGMEADPITLNIVLPLGISFYTFQTMSYTIDVYRGRLRATGSLLEFALFVAFFPQLVAGPIERASHLLPQIQAPRRIVPEGVGSGAWLTLWGFLKKVTIADNVGPLANRVFENPSSTDLDVILGVAAFAVQIYCDFSGYSDIARGISRMMGFDIMVNFRLPFFATTPSDFWQRWHISLSTWLRDYLYIPLGGNRGTELRTYRNLFITMLLGGLWHGAAWNFVLWGMFHGLILIAYRPFQGKGVRTPRGSAIALPLVGALKWALMLTLTLYGWLLFRASSVHQIFAMTAAVSLSPTQHSAELARMLAFYSAPLWLVQLLQHKSRDLLIITKFPVVVRVAIYAVTVLWIFVFAARTSMEFIYFQF